MKNEPDQLRNGTIDVLLTSDTDWLELRASNETTGFWPLVSAIHFRYSKNPQNHRIMRCLWWNSAIPLRLLQVVDKEFTSIGQPKDEHIFQAAPSSKHPNANASTKRCARQRAFPLSPSAVNSKCHQAIAILTATSEVLV